MEVLKFLYYFIGILFIFKELGWILFPVDRMKTHIALKKKLSRIKTGTVLPNDKKDITRFWNKNIVFVLWMFLGFFTFNWEFFLVFLFFEFIAMPILEAVSKNFNYHVGIH